MADDPTASGDDPTVLTPRDLLRVSSDLVVADVLPAGQSDAAPRDSGAFLVPVATRVPHRSVAWLPNTLTPLAGGEDYTDGDAGTVLLPERGRPPARPAGTIASATAHGACDYEVINHLASGGRGDVHLARQIALDRIVALKSLAATMADDAQAREEFLREALVAASMDHPHIITIHDVGLDQHGYPFYAMERARGEPWSERIDALPIATNVAILRRVALAVGHAHERGILHLDIKPANVLIEDAENVNLIDWGMALAVPGRFSGLVPAPPPVMRISGTPSYMAPELAAGHGHRVGPATDIYLLGATLYRAAMGRPPHTGADASSCIACAVRNRPAPVAGVDEELAAIIARAMQDAPDRRYADAAAFAAALAEWLAHQASRDLMVSGRETLRRAQTQGSGYDAFHRAIFAFQTALDRWPESAEAARWCTRARLALATYAFDHGDLELASTQLSGDPAFAALRTRIEEARHHRLAAVRPEASEAGEASEEPCWSPVYTFDAVCHHSSEGLNVVIGKDAVMTGDGILLEGYGLHVALLRQPMAGSVRIDCTCILPYGGEIGFLVGMEGDPREPRSIASGYEIKLGAYDGTEDLAIRQGERLWQRPAQPLAAGMPHRLIMERQGTTLRLQVDDQEWFCFEDLHGPSGPHHDRVGITGWDDPVLLTRLEVATYSERGRTDPYALATRLHVGGAYEAAEGIFAEIERSAVDPALRRRAAAAHFRSGRARALRDDLTAITERLRALWPRSQVRPLEGGLDILLDGADVGDISPLADLPIRRLIVFDRLLHDLAPLIGAPLESAHFNGSAITDLSPLAGAPLRSLSICYTAIEDLEPLAGTPLTMLMAASSQVRDLSPLAQSNLQQLNLAGTPCRDLRPLHGLDLHQLVVAQTEVEDLAPLAGVPLVTMNCSATRIRDLTPLRGAPLRRLYAERCPITDISPLRDLPLTYANLSFCPIRDASPLVGRSMSDIRLSHTEVTSLTGLDTTVLGAAGITVPFAELNRCTVQRLTLRDRCPPPEPGDPLLSHPWISYEHCTVDLEWLDFSTIKALVLIRCTVRHAQRLVHAPLSILGLIQCTGIPDDIIAECSARDHLLIIPDSYPSALCQRLERSWQERGLSNLCHILALGRAWQDGDGATLRSLAQAQAGGSWVPIPDPMRWCEAEAGSQRVGIPIATFDDLDQQRAVGRCGLPLDPFFRSGDNGPWRWLNLSDPYPGQWRSGADPCLSTPAGPVPVRSDASYNPLLLRVDQE